MTHRILVLGAGYAGVLATKRLARQLHHTDVDITLVNARAHFVERVRLHELAAGHERRSIPITELLGRSKINVVVGTAVRLDPEHSRVSIDTGQGREELGYDTLLYALGGFAGTSGVPGVADHTVKLAVESDALELRRQVAKLPPSSSVTVVGGGMTGLEIATELAESHPRLRLRMVTADRLADWLSPGARRHVERVFDRLGIEVRDEFFVARAHSDGVTGADGTTVTGDLTVWTTGFEVPGLAGDAGIAVDADGRIRVDETMRSQSHRQIYAIGDAAVAGKNGKNLRMACGTATPMAFQAADAIASRLTGRRPHGFLFRYVHQNISLGRKDAVIQYVRSDDTVKSARLTGRAAVMYKETINRFALFIQRHPGPYLPHRRRRVVPQHTTPEPKPLARAE